MRPAVRPCRTSTKENSPTWASEIPTVTATRIPNPYKRTGKPPQKVFNAKRRTRTVPTRTGRAASVRGSKSIPTATKKSALKASRNGAISAMVWAPYSVSDRTRPARNAPSARDRPTAEVARAVPRTMTRTATMKSSLRRVATTAERKRGTRTREAKTRAAAVAAVLPSAIAAGPRPPPWPARAGIRSIIGTTARSWKISIPTRNRPCGESISPRSIKRLSAIAVEESAARNPTKTPWATPRPARAMAAAVARSVPATWIDPAPQTNRPSRPRSASDSSRPTVKRSRTTPTSASAST